MLPSTERGLPILPVITLIVILGITATGIERLTSETNQQAQTAVAVGTIPATTPTVTSSAPPAIISSAPRSCEQAIAKALASGKSDDGLAVSAAPAGSVGTLDGCFGAVLKDGATLPLSQNSYMCTGRAGLAFFASDGSVAVRTTPLRSVTTPPGKCAVQICNLSSTGQLCEQAKLYAGGVEVGSSSGGGISLTSQNNVAPIPLTPSDQQEILQAFDTPIEAQEAAVEAATEELKRAETTLVNCHASCNPIEANAVAASAKLQAEQAQLASLQTYRDFLTANATGPGAASAPPPTHSPSAGNISGAGTTPSPGAGVLPGQPTFTPQPPAPGAPAGQPTLPPQDPNAGQPTGGPPPPESSLGSSLKQFWKEWKDVIIGGALIGASFLKGQSSSGPGNTPPQGTCANPPCTPGGGTGGTTPPPRAEISCEPKIADVGARLTVSYKCISGIASSNAFTVTSQPSGVVSVEVATPPIGLNTASYPLVCTNRGQTANAQCTVQVSTPTIIFVANPKTVKSGDTSILGWLTTGMSTCVVSSPEQSVFTAENAFNTSTSGVASSSPISSQTSFLLRCQTLGGAVKEATTTVGVAP